jgi:integrase
MLHYTKESIRKEVVLIAKFKFANGYGYIKKKSGKRRKPFVAGITVGWNDNGTQICKDIGSAISYEKALPFLQKFNDLKERYIMDNKTLYEYLFNNNILNTILELDGLCTNNANKNITAIELFKRWHLKQKARVDSGDLTIETYNNYETVFNRDCIDVHNMLFSDIRTFNIQNCVDKCEWGYDVKKRIQTVFNGMYKIAKGEDIVTTNYAEVLDCGKKNQNIRKKPFSRDKIELMFENTDKHPLLEEILCMIYISFRPIEFREQLIENVKIEDDHLIGGSKTQAGKDRVMIIHPRIKPFIEKRLKNKDSKYLFNNFEGNKWGATNFLDRFVEVLEKIGIKDHQPYDCRKTFSTEADKAKVNDMVEKLQMGHSIGDITKRHYTDKSIEDMKIEIFKIP